ncbi:hypothetical protein [Streptomyces sp. NPDC051909]|uniref:hypothetical protein n=1 Tax=Streptomyces sp. NPDC051909 TaxID=3154944 RepID=UPI0034368B90
MRKTVALKAALAAGGVLAASFLAAPASEATTEAVRYMPGPGPEPFNLWGPGPARVGTDGNVIASKATLRMTCPSATPFFQSYTAMGVPLSKIKHEDKWVPTRSGDRIVGSTNETTITNYDTTKGITLKVKWTCSNQFKDENSTIASIARDFNVPGLNSQGDSTIMGELRCPIGRPSVKYDGWVKPEAVIVGELATDGDPDRATRTFTNLNADDVTLRWTISCGKG